MKKILILILVGTVLSGCSILHTHKMDIEQGNIITTDALAQLHTGMSEAQVKEVMGTPVMVNIFSNNRLEYVYTTQKAYKSLEEKRIVLIFNGGRLSEINKG